MSSVVLLAEADPFDLKLLEEVCENAGYEVITASNGEEILDIIARDRPDLVVMDIAVPVMDGLKVLRILKEDHDLSRIPVVMAAPVDDDELRAKGIELGAQDYITKPYRVFEVQQRIRNLIRVRSAENEAARARALVRNADVIDPETKAGTELQLHISLDYELTRAARYKHNLSCVLVKLKNAGAIQMATDPVTRAEIFGKVGDVLRSCIRGIDHMFRSGSTEFALLLPETDKEGTAVVAGRIQERLDAHEISHSEEHPKPIVSVGVASYPEDGTAADQSLLQKARDQL